MSLNSKKIPLAVRVRNASTLQEAMFEEGVDLVAGQLEIIFNTNTRELTWEEIEYIQSLFTVASKEWNNINFDTESFEQLIENKSRGARFIAYQVVEAEKQDKQFDMTQARKDWAATKELRYWAKSHTEDLTLCGLGYEKYLTEDGIWKPVNRWNDYNAKNAEKRFSVDTGTLLSLGIRYAWQAERFVNLYKEVMNGSRSWRSCYQVSQEKVLTIATTPNYNKLPLWVKKAMVNADAFEVNSDRIGNIWRLKDCARAWKWCGDLPKGIAEQVGRMPVKSRLLAKFAWEEVIESRSVAWQSFHKVNWTDRDGNPISRHELTMEFWATFREYSRANFGQLLPYIMGDENGEWSQSNYSRNSYYIKKHYQTLLEVALDLPHESLPWTRLNLSKNSDQLLLGLVDFLSPQKACEHLFGTTGKATVKAFQNSSPTPRKWAMVLVNNNADLLQKYLNLPESSVIGFQEDAIAFLKSLSPEVALRMLQTTTFKVRGEVNDVDSNLVRDAGYLWKQLNEDGTGAPELGRVRCWLTVHETLAKEYVRRQPDYELKVNPDFKRVQGLCAVDGSWELEIPTCNAQLKLWGEQLSHCIGGYGQAVNSGRSIILAVREQGRVTHTIEMTPSGKFYGCQQFYGYRNSEPPWLLRTSILRTLGDANLYNFHSAQRW
jgi:hypothetical protein